MTNENSVKVIFNQIDIREVNGLPSLLLIVPFQNNVCSFQKNICMLKEFVHLREILLPLL
jgi:hypothetical protein